AGAAGPDPQRTWRAVLALQSEPQGNSTLWHVRPNNLLAPGSVSEWTPFAQTVSVDSISFSPSGTRFLVSAGDKTQIWAFGDDGMPCKSGEVIGANAIWHPQVDTFVVKDTAKSQLISVDAETQRMSPLPLKGLNIEDAVPCVFFRESFVDESSPNWFLVLGTQTKDSAGYSRLSFVPVDSDADSSAESQPLTEIEGQGQITAVAASPTENLLVIGYSTGGVGVWTAAPSLSSDAYEVYDFEEHAGSSIKNLGFDSNGDVMVSVDEAGRAYSWISKDES
ncbi:MAG: hypothetical protein AAF664_04425, partial [Planctomycetota bacterium]